MLQRYFSAGYAAIPVILLLSMNIIPGKVISQENTKSCYLFSYFKGNGEDGLHSGIQP